jgi:hypothetical protein
MTPGERKQLLDSYGNAPVILRAALRSFPKQMWRYRSAPGRWSIHEYVLYLADSEAVEYICCRRFVAEPRSPALTIDTSAWAEMLGYFHQNTREALRIITGLRRSTHRLLATLRESLWHTSFDHSLHGKINMEIWLEIQERRIPAQIDRMKENYRGWLKLNPPSKSPSNRRPQKKAGPMSAGTC